MISYFWHMTLSIDRAITIRILKFRNSNTITSIWLALTLNCIVLISLSVLCFCANYVCICACSHIIIKIKYPLLLKNKVLKREKQVNLIFWNGPFAVDKRSFDLSLPVDNKLLFVGDMQHLFSIWLLVFLFLIEYF